jgi:hypothetical protein
MAVKFKSITFFLVTGKVALRSRFLVAADREGEGAMGETGRHGETCKPVFSCGLPLENCLVVEDRW